MAEIKIESCSGEYQYVEVLQEDTLKSLIKRLSNVPNFYTVLVDGIMEDKESPMTMFSMDSVFKVVPATICKMCTSPIVSAKLGHLDCIEWYGETDHVAEDVLEVAVEYNHKNIIEYVKHRCESDYITPKIVRYASPEVISFLVNKANNPIFDQVIISEAVTRGDIDVFKVLYGYFVNSVGIATVYNNVGMVNAAIKQGYRWHPKDAFQISTSGNLEMLKLFVANKYPFTTEDIERFVKNRHVLCIKHLYEKKVFSPSTILKSIVLGGFSNLLTDLNNSTDGKFMEDIKVSSV